MQNTFSRRDFLTMSAVGAATLATTPLWITQPAMAGAPRVFTGLVAGTGAGGFDVVAYFTEGQPVEGSTDHIAEHDGAQWRFASAANKELFMADPTRYAPQYGGHCAYAAAKGYVAKGVPEAWTVHDDKLYLNFSLSVRDLWLQDVPGNIEKGDANWPGLLA
ncbi:MAG: YHS domain-containing (seleno)protein [Pseudomonadota bacterium]